MDRRLTSWIAGGYVIVLLIVLYAPIMSTALASFSSSRVPMFPVLQFTDRWWLEAFASSRIEESIKVSLEIGVCVAVLSSLFGFASAHLLSRDRPRFELLYVALVSLPALVPALLSGIAWQAYARILGISGTIWAIAIAQTCYCSPFTAVFIKTAYDRLNPDIEIAATNLGATRLTTLIQVVLPQLWPAIFGAAGLAFLLSWDEFMLAWFVGGFEKTVPVMIYETLSTAFDPSLEAVGTFALAVSLGLFIGIVFLRHLLADTRDTRLTP